MEVVFILQTLRKVDTWMSLGAEGPEQEMEAKIRKISYLLFPIPRPSAGEEPDPRQVERRVSNFTGTGLYPAPLGVKDPCRKICYYLCLVRIPKRFHGILFLEDSGLSIDPRQIPESNGNGV